MNFFDKIVLVKTWKILFLNSTYALKYFQLILVLWNQWCIHGDKWGLGWGGGGKTGPQQHNYKKLLILFNIRISLWNFLRHHGPPWPEFWGKLRPRSPGFSFRVQLCLEPTVIMFLHWADKERKIETNKEIKIERKEWKNGRQREQPREQQRLMRKFFQSNPQQKI